MKILAVDDSKVMRITMEGAIKMLNHECLEAEDGQKAIDLMAVHGIEVAMILMDWNMPVKNGFDALVELRSNPSYANIPIIMISTEAEQVNFLKAMKAGATHYLIKPLAAAAISEGIKSYLK